MEKVLWDLDQGSSHWGLELVNALDSFGPMVSVEDLLALSGQAKYI